MSKESDKKTLPAGSHHPIVVPPAQGSPPAAVTLWPPFPDGAKKPAAAPSKPPTPGLEPEELMSAAEAAEAAEEVDNAWSAPPPTRQQGPRGTELMLPQPAAEPKSAETKKEEPKLPASDKTEPAFPEPAKPKRISLPPPKPREHAHDLGEMLPLTTSGDRPSPEPFSIADVPLPQPPSDEPKLDLTPVPAAHEPPTIDLPPPVILPGEVHLSFLEKPSEEPVGRSAEPARDDAVGPPALSPEVTASERAREQGRELADAAQRLWGRTRQRWDALEPRRRKMMLGVAGGLGALTVFVVIGVAACPSSKTATTTASVSPSSAVNAPSQASEAPQPSATPSAAAASSVAAPAGASGPCAPSGDPVQLSPKVSKDVPLELRADQERSELAVGFAADDRTAAGLVLDLRTLQVKDRFLKPAGKISRVVPVPGDKGFSFEVHGQGKGVRSSQSVVLTTSPAKLASWKGGTLSVGPLDGEPTATVDLEDKVSAVRAVAAPGHGAAIAARAGESVKLAWVDESGKLAGTPARVDSPATKFGSPSLAWNGQSVLVAFAERDGEDTPWGIRIATAPFGSGPLLNRTWEAPAGGPGGAAIAPSVAGLERGAWLMVWTEGKQGERQVRMQTWDKDLKPLDAGSTVSGSGNAGQGSGIAAGGRGMVAFLTGAKGHALWATAIGCP